MRNVHGGSFVANESTYNWVLVRVARYLREWTKVYLTSHIRCYLSCYESLTHEHISETCSSYSRYMLNV